MPQFRIAFCARENDPYNKWMVYNIYPTFDEIKHSTLRPTHMHNAHLHLLDWNEIVHSISIILALKNCTHRHTYKRTYVHKIGFYVGARDWTCFIFNAIWLQWRLVTYTINIYAQVCAVQIYQCFDSKHALLFNKTWHAHFKWKYRMPFWFFWFILCSNHLFCAMFFVAVAVASQRNPISSY